MSNKDANSEKNTHALKWGLSDLIVHNYVNCAMSGVCWEITEVESLIYNALTGKCSIAVEKNAHDLATTKYSEDKLKIFYIN